MANLYELKFENYGVCLNIEINSIEKNAFLCEQIDENQGFETNILKIRELGLDDIKNDSNSSDLILGSNVEVYSIIMLNDQLKNIHGWQPATIKELRGDYCLVDLYMNGALQSKIVEKKFIRNAIDDEEYRIISYDHLKFYKMDFLNLLDEKAEEKINDTINFQKVFDKKKVSDLFLQDIKQIINPFFCFINMNEHSNILVMHEDVDEDLVNQLLDTSLQHYKEVYEREKFMLEFYKKNLRKENEERAGKISNQDRLEKASVDANYLYMKNFCLEKKIFEIIEPKIDFYKSNFDIFFEVKNQNEEFHFKVYSNSLQLLMDCVRDLHIIEKNLEFNVNRKIPFFNIKSEEYDSFKKYAENFNILFYEIISINDSRIRVKLLGNENNIKLLKNSTENYLANNKIYYQSME